MPAAEDIDNFWNLGPKIAGNDPLKRARPRRKGWKPTNERVTDQVRDRVVKRLGQEGGAAEI